MEENKITKMYDLVFEDMVKNYIEDRNYNEEMEEEYNNRVELTESEIKEIAHKLIYKNEYVWEIINDTIEQYIEDYYNKD